VRIQTKVFLTILLMSTTLVSLTLGLVLWSMDQGLLDYVNQRQIERFTPLATELELRYAEDQWQSLQTEPVRYERLQRRFLDTGSDRGLGGQRMRDRPPPPQDRPARAGADDPPPRHDRRPPPRPGVGGSPASLVNAQQQLVAGPPPRNSHAQRIILQHNNATVGYLVLPDTNPLTDSFSLQFQARQESAIAIIGLVILSVSGLFAFIISPRIVKPIAEVASAANAMGRGSYAITLPEQRKDEIGELGRDMNQLATTLQRSEQMRQRWLADTSHELRTPLAIIKGEIEAMLDGIRAFDHANLLSLKQEADHLHKLIDDLTDLSNADIGSLRYQMQSLDLNMLVERNREHIDLLAQDANLRLTLETDTAHQRVYADQQRLQQLLDNLITNSCKYSDPGGVLHISLKSVINADNSWMVLVVEDSAPAVPAQHLPHLFDYLYRVESSRNRQTGGAGLGLAIAARIVAAHKGEITALPSDLGGLKVVVRLPIT
jgi:two-component system sensor histidine kinase BaeS